MVEINTSTTPQFYDHLFQSVTEGYLVLDQEGLVTSASQDAGSFTKNYA